MTFAGLALENVLRRPARSVLTVSGVTIAIGAVVTLSSIAWGFEGAWERLYEARGTDLIVIRSGGPSPMPARFPMEMLHGIDTLPGIRAVSPLLNAMISVEHVPFVLLLGVERGSFVWDHLRLLEGRWPENDDVGEVALGDLAAERLGKTIGSVVEIEGEPFVVEGVFDSGSVLENGSVVMALPRLQRLMRDEGRVNFVNLRVDPALTEEERMVLGAAIAERWPGFRALAASQLGEQTAAIRLVSTMSAATTWIATVVGAIGVMNTMMMSVTERTRDIGILLAVGWRRRRIVRLVLYEALLLSLAGGVSGLAAGIASVKLLERTPLLDGKMVGDVGLPLAALALGVALLLGLSGSLYPALRASRLEPALALRYE